MLRCLTSPRSSITVHFRLLNFTSPFNQKTVNAMDASNIALLSYFEDYAASAAEPSGARTAAFYADSFIAAGPRGSAVFENDHRFLDWLRNVREFNQRAGMLSVNVVSIESPVHLSPLHLLATVEWGARFRNASDRVITFRIAYLLENSSDQWKILAYISEKDQEEEMQKSGL